MAIKFSQFNLRTDHTSGMYLVGYDGNQNIHITVDNLFDDFINGTPYTIPMFDASGAALTDSIITQSGTSIAIAGTMTVTSDATFSTNIEVEGTADFNGNVNLGDESGDLITQTGTLYLNGPIKDTTDTLGAVDQILVSDASGELTFTNLSEITTESAEAIVQTIKCNEAIPKGYPVYIVGFQPGQNANIVAKADASNPAKMPATGVADEDYAAQDFGTMTAFGSFNGDFDTTGGTENWSVGDILYVKPGGGLTNIKPTGTNLIQNIAIVSRVQAQTGEIEVIALGRTNDIPNLTQGKIWVGSTGNTIESTVVHLDETNNEMGINTNNPAAVLHVTRSTGSVPLFQVDDVGDKFFQVLPDSNTTFLIGDLDALGGNGYIKGTFDSIQFHSESGELVRIKDNGNVGIGTTNPQKNLVVSDSSVPTIRIDNTKNGTWTAGEDFGGLEWYGNDASGEGPGIKGYIKLDSDNIYGAGFDMRFGTTDGTNGITERMVIAKSGNVGIGTNNPAKKLTLEGGGFSMFADGGTSADAFSVTTHNYSFTDENEDAVYSYNGTDGHKFSTGGNDRLNIIQSGYVGIGVTNPTRKLTVEAATNPVLIGTPTGKRMQWENPNYITAYSESPTAAGVYNKTFDFDGDYQGGGYVGVYNSIDGNWGVAMHAAHRLNASGHKSNILHVVQVDDHSSNIRVESRDFGSDAQRFSGIEINDSRTPTGYPANRFRLGTGFSTEPTIPFYANGEGWFNGTSSNTKAALKVTESGDRLFEVAPDNSTAFLLGDLDALGDETYIKGSYSNIEIYSNGDLTAIFDASNNVGVGVALPRAKLDVNGGVRIANDSTTASATNVGTLRYRTSGNNSYVDMVMQTGASTYEWVNIVQNNW